MSDSSSDNTDGTAYMPVRGRDLAVGRPVPYSIYDTYDRLLLRRGRILKNEEQRQLLLELGRTRATPANTDPLPKVAPRKNPRQDDGTELQFDPFETFKRCAHSLNQVYRAIDLGRDNFLPRLERLISQLGNLIDRDPDAALGAAHADRNFSTSVVHPIRQAIVSDLVARAAGLTGEQRRAAVGASLSANFGMLQLQEQLDQQTKPLTEDQRERLREHPERSATILMNAGLEDRRWLRAVCEHHERLDGSGYPHGLTRDQISDEAAIVMLADVYMAMVTPRAHRPAHVIRKALRELFEEAGNEFHATYTSLLIREVGVYPPGTMVGLSTGETGLVTRRGPTSTEPQVFLLRRGDGSTFMRPRFRNLSEDEEDDRVEITHVYRHEDVPILYSPHVAWGYESESG